MHVVCIGVKRKELEAWVFGKLDTIRFSKSVVAEISSYLLQICKFIPSRVFVRKTRTLLELPRWKATELRLDLLHHLLLTNHI